MRCPKCGSPDYLRWRGPRVVDGTLLRRHTCQKCGTLFLSVQEVVTGARLEQLLDRLES